MTPLEQKLFFVPEENLFRALERCLACITSNSYFPEELARVAPALTGEKREQFLMALYSLGKSADRSPYAVPEIFALSDEIRQIIEERTIFAENDDVADFVEVIGDFIIPICLAARQLIRNWETHTSSMPR